MNRVFVTGDKHGDFSSDRDYRFVKEFCKRAETTTDDVLIVLGDHGIHYDGAWSDHDARKRLSEIPVTFVMIRGNHDMRPEASWKYEYVSNGAMSGYFVRDPEADNVLYTEEYGWYSFGDMPAFVICGAYSADKWYRLDMQRSGHTGYRWFPDEQLSEREMQSAYDCLFDYARSPFVILSHTCPLNFKPTEGLLPYVDQSTVDESMEKFMNEIYLELMEMNAPLARWYCGHWHVDKTIEPVRFMYHDIEELKGTEPWRRVSTTQTVNSLTSPRTKTSGSEESAN